MGNNDLAHKIFNALFDDEDLNEMHNIGFIAQPLGYQISSVATIELELDNNHDRMVEEIAEFRVSEADLVNRNEDLLCIIDDLTRIARALDKPEKHTNSQHKRAKIDLCKLLAKLNQEGGE